MHYELEEAAREIISAAFGDDLVAWPNLPFTPPEDARPYAKFDYIPAISEAVGISRKCRYYVGIVQVGIVFKPGGGTDMARRAAQIICDKTPAGLELSTGFVYTAGEVMQTVKTKTGWMIPVRFKVRFG